MRLGQAQSVVDRLTGNALSPVEAAQTAKAFAMIAAAGDLVRELLDEAQTILERRQRFKRLVQFQVSERQIDEFPRRFHVHSLGLDVVRVHAVAFQEENEPLRWRLPGLLCREPLQEWLQ